MLVVVVALKTIDEHWKRRAMITKKKTTTMSCTHCHRHVKATTKFKEMTMTCGCGGYFLGGSRWVLKKRWQRCCHPRGATKFKEMTTTTSCGETICSNVASHQNYPWWGIMVVWNGTKLTDWGLIPQFVKQVQAGKPWTWIKGVLERSPGWTKCPPKGSNLVLFLGGLGWESVGS